VPFWGTQAYRGGVTTQDNAEGSPNAAFRFLAREEFDLLTVAQKMEYLKRACKSMRTIHEAFREVVETYKMDREA
jgi:hypothetical protein